MPEIPPKFRLPRKEWLFKQSEYGGVKHIALNIDEWATYIASSNPSTELRIETLCGKNLKYNLTWSVMTPREGLVRNLCIDCMMQYDSEAKAQEAEERNKAYDSRPDKEYPF